MTVYDRRKSTEFRLVDRFDEGFGWLAHPDERGRRTSHAVVARDGVWLFDPLDAPGIDEAIDDLGDVVGIAVCSNFHARDADRFAERYGVSVWVPRGFDRAAKRIDAPVERFDGALGGSGFAVRTIGPLPGWREAVAYRPEDGTLYVPDVLGTAPLFTVGDERLAVYLFCRPFPPDAAFSGIEPNRILVGHGTGIFDDAADALEAALANARRGFPRALATNGPAQIGAGLAALRD